MKHTKLFEEFLNESKLKLSDFDFEYDISLGKRTYYVSWNAKGIEAIIHLGYGSFGGGRSERKPYLSHLEYEVGKLEGKEHEQLEEFIDKNLDYILSNAKKI